MIHLPLHSTRTPERVVRPAATRLARALAVAACALGAGLATAGCGPRSTEKSIGSPGTEGSGFLVDANQGGNASKLLIEGIYAGRLVSIYDEAAGGAQTLQYEDFLAPSVVANSFDSDGDFQGDSYDYDGDLVPDFVLDATPLTGTPRLVIKYEHGTDDYDDALAWLNDVANLDLITAKSLAATEGGPFDRIPRNSALAIRTNDLLDHATITDDTVLVFTGYPPNLPYETRIFPDPNHGAEVGGTFASTRIIIDMTVSELEAADAGVSINELGLPAAVTTLQANVGLRIPTTPDPGGGLFQVVRNLTGKAFDKTQNGPLDTSVPTQDLMRAMRSGGSTASTGDPFNGFLPDMQRPRLVAQLQVFVASTPAPSQPDPVNEPDLWELTWTFTSLDCSFTPEVGDVLRWPTLPGEPDILAEVTAPGTAPVNGVVSDVQVTLIDTGANLPPVAGAAFYVTRFSDAKSSQYPCFVGLTSVPDAFPGVGIDPSTTFLLRFSEAMDPASVQSLDTVLLTSAADGMGNYVKPSGVLITRSFVAAKVNRSDDLKQFALDPVLPLNHKMGTAEPYFLELVTGASGLRDLAGNSMSETIPIAKYTIRASAPTDRTGNFVLRFDAIDEDGNTKSEVIGQVARDLDLGILRPRPVQRFSTPIERGSDPDNLQNLMTTYPGATATPFDNGIREPLIPLGCRMMMVWRYADMGLDVNDLFTYDIDVEGLHWSPLNGQADGDFYPQFQIAGAHAAFLPDEGVDTTQPQPFMPYENSGLKTSSWVDNVLNDPQNPLKILHPYAKGYLIDPARGFITAEENPMQPYPLNLDVPDAQKVFMTWRNTAIRAVGGDPSPPPANPISGFQFPPHGPDLFAYFNTGTGNFVANLGDNGAIASAPFIPSIGMPLLLEFQTGVSSAVGLNRLDTAAAGNPAASNGTYVPRFRIYSSGGIDAGNLEVKVVPSLQTQPVGGFNTVSGLPIGIGAPTPPGDDNVYMGQVDFVVRLSRIHSLFITTMLDPDTAEASTFAEPVIEYFTDGPPPGTDIVMHYRGAFDVEKFGEGAPGPSPAGNGEFLDAYGDQPSDESDTIDTSVSPSIPTQQIYAPPSAKNPKVTFLNNDDTWKSNLNDIAGARAIQFRATFVGNTQTGVVPELSGIGLAWDLPD